MILAAGLGTRLSPITDAHPKALVPVAGVPNIVRLLVHLRESGIAEIVINTHHLAEVLQAVLGDGSAHGVAIAYSHEKELLGTGGAIKRALPLLGSETFVVLNGDALFLPDLRSILAAHRKANAMATLVVRENPSEASFEPVRVDAQGRIRSVLHSGARTPNTRSTMFTGTHILERSIAEHLPDSGCIVRTTYVKLVDAGAHLQGYLHGGAFFDLGTPSRLLQANCAIATGQARIPGYEPSELGVHIGRDVVLGQGCRIGKGTVLCDGAVVENGVSLERCLLMPGAIARGDLCDAILMSDGTVVQGSLLLEP
jgi:NDP-sugar pyrophosphorylase family protein